MASASQLVTPSVWDTFALRNSKDLDTTVYSYKIGPAGATYGLDVPFGQSLDIDESTMSLWLPICDGNRRDGVGDLLSVDGISTERHYRRPLVLFDHGKTVTLPIARAREKAHDPESYTFKIDVLNKTAGCRAYFYTGKEDCDPALGCKQYDQALFAEQCFDMIVKDMLGAGSIGYSIISAEHLPPDYTTGLPQGLHLLKTLLLECSSVVLPANMDTVSKILSGDKICGKQASPYLVKALTPYTPPRKAQAVSGYTKELKVPNYRKADDPEESCETCEAYTPHGGQFGHCRMFDVSVGPDMTCDRWISGEKSLEEHGPNCKCAKCAMKYNKKSCGCDSCSKGHDCPCGELPKENKYITHDGDKWKVHAESGKVLGTHDSEKDAKAQLQAIEINKHKGLSPNDYSWTHESLKSLRGKYKAAPKKPKASTPPPAQAPAAGAAKPTTTGSSAKPKTPRQPKKTPSKPASDRRLSANRMDFGETRSESGGDPTSQEPQQGEAPEQEEQQTTPPNQEIVPTQVGGAVVPRTQSGGALVPRQRQQLAPRRQQVIYDRVYPQTDPQQGRVIIDQLPQGGAASTQATTPTPEADPKIGRRGFLRQAAPYVGAALAGAGGLGGLQYLRDKYRNPQQRPTDQTPANEPEKTTARTEAKPAKPTAQEPPVQEAGDDLRSQAAQARDRLQTASRQQRPLEFSNPSTSAERETSDAIDNLRRSQEERDTTRQLQEGLNEAAQDETRQLGKIRDEQVQRAQSLGIRPQDLRNYDDYVERVRQRASPQQWMSFERLSPEERGRIFRAYARRPGKDMDSYAYNTKSLQDLRDKYKTPKGRYHTVRKPQDGSATVTLGTKDVDKLRDDANNMGISVTWMSDDGKGNSKVKLSGGMAGIEKLATKHGRMVRKVKNLPQQSKSTNVIGTIEPDEEVVKKGKSPTVSRERSSIGNLSDPSSLLDSEGGTEEDGRPKNTPVLTARGKNMKTKAADPLMDDSVKKPDDGGVHQEPGVGGEAFEEGSSVTKEDGDLLGGGEEEAYGAQVTRRMHADMAGLLHEYDEFLNHTEDEATRKIVLDQINHFIDSLEKLEQHFSTHERYKDYPPLDGMGQPQEDEEGMGGKAPSAAETGKSDAASEEPPEPDPTEVLEGLQAAGTGINPDEDEETLKSLYKKHVKSLRTKHKDYGREVTEQEDEKEQREKAKYLRKQLTMLGNADDSNSKKLRAFYVKHIKKCDTLLQGKDKEHTPGSDKEKHDGMDITQEETPKTKSLQGKKDMKDDKEHDDEELRELDKERKYLKSRWKTLKSKKEDEFDKEEKSYIAYRWKALENLEKKLKSVANVKHRKDATRDNGVIGKFLKKFSKDHKSVVEESEKFLKSLEDEEKDLDDSMRLKAYHFGCSLDKVLAHGMGNGDYTKGLENLQKALITDEEVDVQRPSSNSQIGKPGHDKMPYDEGGHLISKKEGFPDMGHGASVDVNEESSNSQLKVGHDKMPYDGQHLISSKESFPEMGKTGTIDVEDPSSNAVVSRGIGKEPMQQYGVGGSLVKFMRNVADSGAFLKALAYEKAFGLNHRLIASRLAKALEMDLPFVEQFKSVIPGDLPGLLQEEGEEEHKKPKKDKKSMEEDEEKKDMPGMGGGMGSGMGGGGGTIPDLDEEEDPMNMPGFAGKSMKFLDTLSHDTLAQSQTINALNQSLTNLMARLG